MNHLGLCRFCSSFVILLVIVAQQSASQSTQQHSSPQLAPKVQLSVTTEEITAKLPLTPPVESATTARVHLRLLNPEDVVRAEATDDINLEPGQKELLVKLTQPLAKVPPGERNELRWLRLQYEVRLSDGRLISAGIEALRTPQTDLFSLTAAAATSLVSRGRPYQVPVHAKTHNNRPLSGVQVRGELSWDDAEGTQKLTASTVTNASGDGTLRFSVPETLHAESGDLDIEATHGLVSRSIDGSVYFNLDGYFLLDTDKDIYQPGQTLHSRILRFNSERKAAKNEALDVRITDEEDTLILRQQVITDAFGIARLDWAIPSGVRLGNYLIRVFPLREDDPSDRESGVKSVRIYRYDLPNFRVMEKPDRTYYFPAQNAEVTVSAEYLFGKPVTRGKVRVVEEESRTWDFSKQEWEVTTGQVQSGELDRDGHFTARFDLSSHHQELKDASYTRFRDVSVAAYVTDLTTGHTEQRRVSLRVTREPIHVYALGLERASGKLPPSYYISTFYADGTPARCKVQLSWFDEDDKTAKQHPLRTLETNRYGLAKATELKIPVAQSHSLLIQASDSKGLTGSDVEDVGAGDWDALALTTSHAIHKRGEPVEVTVRSSKPSLRIVVEAVHEGTVVATQHLTLSNGLAELVFPYDERFRDEVNVIAYSLDEGTTSTGYMEGLVTVLYPRNRTLGVAVHLDKDEHRPGEDANVRFAVRSPDQPSGETALGVKIVDAAVDERAQTDSDFGQREGWGTWRWSLWPSSNTGFGNVSRDDLDQIDLTQPVPADLDLVAEYILRSGRYGTIDLLAAHSDRSIDDAFSKLIGVQLQPLDAALTDWMGRGTFPHNQDELRTLGAERGVDFLSLRDPWGTPYVYKFGFAGSNYVLQAISAGPDKQLGTEDDVTRTIERKFFFYYGKMLESLTRDLMEKEGRFIRDRKTLQAEMLKHGVDFDSLRDPWGKPYQTRFFVSGSSFVTEIISRAEPAASKKQNETVVWQDKVDYFLKAREHIDQVMSAHLRAGGAYPTTEQEFRAILLRSGVDLDELHDPWGSPYYVVFNKVTRYGDRVTIRQSDAISERATEPVTLVEKELSLMSSGFDKMRGTNDDFAVASYAVFVSEQSAKDEAPKPAPASGSLTANTGAITGTVTDPSGAVVPRVNVQITRAESGEQYSTKTGDDGTFILKDLKVGTYTLLASAPGFQVVKTAEIPVQSMRLTEMNIVLPVGTTTETVEVAAAAPAVETTSTSVSKVVSGSSLPRVNRVQVGAMSTPRLRQDFPETMLWEPALITDHRGHARLNFKLADNITTWKLTAVASTKNGEIGHAEKDLRAFQPFFVEHEPPRILTQGDEIALAVVLRNYLDRSQTLKAWIKPETWFTLLGSAETSVKVEAGDSAPAVFRYRAAASVKDGRQQVSAANSQISDAAQKLVDVHPFGRPASVTAASVMVKDETLVANFPNEAITGSLQARVKVYPNLLAHIIENLEAGLEVPHGCGEQTISSTYPSLLVTEIYANSADKPAIAHKARRYLAAGYERLLSYQDISGGFTYWGHGSPDLALTTYALQFLHHAARYIDVDGDVMQKAMAWVLAQQDKDGAWHGRWDRDDRDALMQTSYIARILSSINNDEDKPGLRLQALEKALDFLALHRDLVDEPYVIANYALAARASSSEAIWAELADRLRKSVHHEGIAAYWALEQNTPFYEWGRTGRVESTALVLRALAVSGAPAPDDKELLRRGLLFLLRSEDKEGMWSTGQATVNVLQTLLSMVDIRLQENGAKMLVRVNGHDAATLDLPSGQGVAAPLEVDVTSFVKTGENRVQLQTSSESMMTVQFAGESYVPWKDAETAPALRGDANSTLRLGVAYSTTEIAAGETVECHVRAERVGFRGYGMMLGEIGLPPGSDVDRESLEHALEASHSLFQYDVLPDRVILYLWPTAGGSEITFRFRPRFAMRAETAPSVLYDYYNPEATVTVKPVRFEVGHLEAKP